VDPRSGFTLLEVLVSLVILAAALAVIAQGFSAGAQSSMVAKDETTAARLADKKMSEVETGEIPVNRGEQGTFPEPEGFRYEISTEAEATTGLYRITVTVYYPDGSGGERSVALHRLMRERPTATP
jgi:type II secretion system protein I